MPARINGLIQPDTERDTVSKYQDLQKAAAEGRRRKQEMMDEFNNDQRQREKLVLDLMTELCRFLGWPAEQTRYINLKTNKAEQGPITGVVPCLLVSVDRETGKDVGYATGIELQLAEPNVRPKEIWLRFDFFLSDKGREAIFGGVPYSLSDSKQRLFDEVYKSIERALHSGEETNPIRLHWTRD
jgi:hypothetical protein